MSRRNSTILHFLRGQKPYPYVVVAFALAVSVLLSGSASSAVTWRGDFETGDLSQWVYGVQQKAAGRVSVVTSPVRDGRYAARYEVDPGDNNVAGSGNNERAETLLDQATTDGYAGREQWWGWSTYFASGYSASTSGWNYFTQFHNTSSTGQVNAAFAAPGNQLALRICYGSDPTHPGTRWWTFDTDRRNGVWYDFVFHVKWSSDPNVGFVELWENGKNVIPLTHIATVYPGGGVYLKQGYYRSPQSSTAVLYFDGARRGDSYQSVVAGFPAGAWSSAPDSPTLPKPTITGTPSVGSSVQASVNTSGLDSEVAGTLRYQWRRCDSSGAGCQDIAGATAAGYALTSADAGSTLRVVASVTNASGATVSSTSDAVGPVSTSTALPPPTISGTPAVGNVLTTSVDTSSVTSDLTSVSYQWQHCASGGSSCTDLQGATGTSHPVDQADVGYALRVRATVKTVSGTLTSTSKPTAVVPAPATAPTGTDPGLGVSSSISDGQTLSGKVSWTASVNGGTPTRVEFSIDGSLKSTEKKAPYVFNGDGKTLDTASLANGSHTFTVKAYAGDGTATSASATAKVSNGQSSPAPQPTQPTANFGVTSSIANGQTLAGKVPWTASVSGGTPSRVEFYVDGSLKWTEKLSPYVFNGDGASLDTTTLADGNHTFEVKAYASGGAVTSASATAKVSNVKSSAPAAQPSASQPSASPAAASKIGVSSSVANGQTLSGAVGWTATVDGKAAKVDFYVDGSLKWTEKLSPYVFNGDGAKLDTKTLSNGKHTLMVKATGTDGSTASTSATVTVKN